MLMNRTVVDIVETTFRCNGMDTPPTAYGDVYSALHKLPSNASQDGVIDAIRAAISPYVERDYANFTVSQSDNGRNVKCPRCWHWHGVVENHDSLCDRCCHVLVENFPEHESVPFIHASLEAQRLKYARPRAENNHAN